MLYNNYPASSTANTVSTTNTQDIPLPTTYQEAVQRPLSSMVQEHVAQAQSPQIQLSTRNQIPTINPTARIQVPTTSRANASPPVTNNRSISHQYLLITPGGVPIVLQAAPLTAEAIDMLNKLSLGEKSVDEYYNSNIKIIPLGN